MNRMDDLCTCGHFDCSHDNFTRKCGCCNCEKYVANSVQCNCHKCNPETDDDAICGRYEQTGQFMGPSDLHGE